MSSPQLVQPNQRQLTFDELGTPLSEVTFVVVDLETTGGKAGVDAITEIGAVKVRGGEVVGELATLVDPERGIPPQISQITGITSAMVHDAPTIAAVLPAFLEFAAGAVLVAHNAPFDTGFLKAACERLGLPWPAPRVLCTVKLARRVLTRDEAPSVRLSALSALFGTETLPTHRALDDARATVEVMHRLFERVGNLGVHSYEELVTFLPAVTPTQRRKRSLAEHLPSEPGVYLFRGPGEEVLYVGTATDLRRRVRSYFTGSETRTRIKEMVALATRVDSVSCAHALEAGVRELRLLAHHAPPYNRRSKFPHKAWWVTLTDEAFPRLSVVRTPRDGALGPFSRRSAAVEAAQVLADASAVRPCSQRIPLRSPSATPCALHEMNRCAAPCAGLQSATDYARGPRLVAEAVAGRDTRVLLTLVAGVEELSTQCRFESAAQRRDEAAALIAATRRAQRLAALAAVDELVAARPDGSGGWELVVVRCGRLASAGTAPRGVHPVPVVDVLVASAETVLPGPGPLRGAPAEEVGLVARWLEQPGVRLVRASTPYAEPAWGAGRWTEWAVRARTAAREPLQAQHW
ncbi:DEDD exonuclease domain-containing protein [Rhodococcus sp. X156]|uniref:DEDD exonuclease domain-containing protein n=1 Tax=Rhodococcus sp. X156 TaxID=2499145 RepID=UPI000FDBE24A|nr:DEDD exonuclease domain-containing protein [Rhodococcus sp. X156]